MQHDFERDLIRFVVEHENPSLFGQLEFLEIRFRDRTNAGMFVELDNRAPNRSLVEKQTLGQTVLVRANGPKTELGATLYVDLGLIRSLEVFVHGYAAFPEVIANYELLRLR